MAFCNSIRVALAVAALAGAAAPAAGAHLLVTEVGYDPVDETGATAEYVEILNPGPGAVDLGAFWLANDEEAYPLLVHGPILSGITSLDFVYRFPAVSLTAGRLAVVCHDSDTFLAAYFPADGLAGFQALPGAPLLFEVTADGAADGVADLVNYGSNPTGTLSLANNGECVGLATWNGIDDRVVDHDWVCWLTLTYIPNKDVDYPLGIDGPDPGTDESWFLEDAGTAVAAPDAPEGSAIHRVSTAEPAEITTGGNGAGGHDETSEDWSSWIIGPFSPGRSSLATVGVAAGATPARLGFAVAGRHPTRDAVTFAADLPEAGWTRLLVRDLAGRVVSVAFDGALPSGSHRFAWDGRDAAGHRAPAGLYFARLEQGSRHGAVKFVRLP